MSDPELRQFDGGYLLFRRNGKKGLRRKYAGTPQFRHRTLEDAQTEGKRLLSLFPDSSFVICHEVGTIKAVAPAEDLCS